MAVLMIGTVTASSFNLLDDGEEIYTITIESNKMEKVTIYAKESDIINFGEKSKDMSKMQKVQYLLKTFDIPLDFMMKIAGQYMKNGI